MTITSPTRQRRPLAARLALVSTVSVGLLAGPVAVAGPASAMGDHGKNDKVNCWVEAKKPYLVKLDNHHKFAKVDFAFKIKCDKNAKVTWHQWTLKEKGYGHSELIKYHKGDVDVRKNHVVYDSNKDRVDKERGDNKVKVFHIVKIDFKKDNGKGRGSDGHDSSKSQTLTIRFSGGGY